MPSSFLCFILLIFYTRTFSCRANELHSLPDAFSPTGTSSDTIKKLLFPSRSFARPSSWLSPRAMRWAPFVAGFTGRELDVQATTTSRVSARIFKRGRGSWLIFACMCARMRVRGCARLIRYARFAERAREKRQSTRPLNANPNFVLLFLAGLP